MPGSLVLIGLILLVSDAIPSLLWCLTSHFLLHPKTFPTLLELALWIKLAQIFGHWAHFQSVHFRWLYWMHSESFCVCWFGIAACFSFRSLVVACSVLLCYSSGACCRFILCLLVNACFRVARCLFLAALRLSSLCGLLLASCFLLLASWWRDEATPGRGVSMESKRDEAPVCLFFACRCSLIIVFCLLIVARRYGVVWGLVFWLVWVCLFASSLCLLLVACCS